MDDGHIAVDPARPMGIDDVTYDLASECGYARG